METKKILRHVNRLLLDPNNYRFIDKPGYVKVPMEEIEDPRIQQRTYNLLVGKNNENITDLVSSFKENGFLNLDQIQVKETASKNFLVVEGNRRVATLKFLYSQFGLGFDIGKLTEADFKSVELVLHVDEDPRQHLIAMGLHHISGKRRWSPINQAQLIYDLINTHGMTEEEVCNSLGITKHNIRRNLRVLSLIDRYKNSDYGDQFESNMYSIFEEMVKKTEIKAWLDWDNNEMIPTNIVNEEKLFSWISKEESIERDEEGNDHTILRDPIITKSHEIRELSKYISDPKAIEKMEESRSITAGFASSDAIGEARLHNALDTIKKEVQTAFNFSEFMDNDDTSEIIRLRDKLDKLVPSGNILLNEKKTTTYFESINSHFTQLNIRSYRKVSDVEVSNLNKVNIFVGGNNTGKTSILESFYLVTQLNDINKFLDLERYRGKFFQDFNPKWIDRNFTKSVKLQAVFNNSSTSIEVRNEETNEFIDKTSYISSISIDAFVDDISLTSHVNLYSNRDAELFYQKAQILCQAAFTSPYRYNDEMLKRAHAYAVKEKLFDDIVQFLRQNLDPSIEKIEMVNIEGESRFFVSSIGQNNSIDITKYGEGLQRIFEITMLMIFCRNGIICIDEVDSAIHKSLLIKFTEFIQKLADKCNVQVFLSTHSKECIDAFIENEYHNERITAYSLVEKEGKIVCKYIEGTRLEKLVDSINLDIR